MRAASRVRCARLSPPLTRLASSRVAVSASRRRATRTSGPDRTSARRQRVARGVPVQGRSRSRRAGRSSNGQGRLPPSRWANGRTAAADSIGARWQSQCSSCRTPKSCSSVGRDVGRLEQLCDRKSAGRSTTLGPKSSRRPGTGYSSNLCPNRLSAACRLRGQRQVNAILQRMHTQTRGSHAAV